MGSMVGDDDLGNQVGMAPGARWIGCRNMNVGVGTPETYTKCFQWFLAPTDLNDLNPRPDLAPDVINNSWSCPTSEGCDANVTQINCGKCAGGGDCYRPIGGQSRHCGLRQCRSTRWHL